MTSQAGGKRETISIALVGVGGYGNHYVNELLDTSESGFRVVAAIDPSPKSCRRLDELKARGVELFESLERFYAKGRADLTIVCSPLHMHADHTCAALEHGSHVLCEKPLCVTPAQIKRIVQARDAAQKHVAIGYQWSFSRAIQSLKGDILAGKFGRPKRMKSMVLWPRDEVYYSRNRWAGAIRDATGNWVLDSPVNNACAHYLHNLLYLARTQIDRSAQPTSVTAELYRAQRIENYDTAALRCTSSDGVEFLFIASHSTAYRKGPCFSCELERGVVEFEDRPEATILARFADGSVKDYGSPADPRDRKLWDTIEAIRVGADSVCGIEAASAHTLAAWAAQASMPEIAGFDSSLVRVTGEAPARKTSVNGLGEILERCYERWALPSELRATWTRSGREVLVAELPEK